MAVPIVAPCQVARPAALGIVRVADRRLIVGSAPLP